MLEAESGERFEVEADNVINATGVFADQIRPEEVIEEEDVPRIKPSRGTHLLIDREQLSTGSSACIVPAGAGRQIFALPWYGRTLVGTTDNDYEGETEHPHPSDEDVEYLLDAVNAFFGIELGRGDLVGAYAGVRPLLSTGDPKKSVDISRKAELYETSSGMLTITGGKLTTWRRMAKMTVDRLVEREGREAPCHTAEIPLGMPARPEDLEAPEGVGEISIAQLAFRYGHAARTVLKLAAREPEAGRADRRGPPRPARRGRRRRPPRAGAQRRRRAPAPHPARPGRRPAAARRPTRPARSPRRSAASWAGRGAGSSRRRRPGRGRSPRPASTPPSSG